jgi:hypothetical protein
MPTTHEGSGEAPPLRFEREEPDAPSAVVYRRSRGGVAEDGAELLIPAALFGVLLANEPRLLEAELLGAAVVTYWADVLQRTVKATASGRGLVVRNWWSYLPGAAPTTIPLTTGSVLVRDPFVSRLHGTAVHVGRWLLPPDVPFEPLAAWFRAAGLQVRDAGAPADEAGAALIQRLRGFIGDRAVLAAILVAVYSRSQLATGLALGLGIVVLLARWARSRVRGVADES